MGEMTTIRVEVTAEDIAAGCKGHSENCPIHRALRRHIDTDSIYTQVTGHVVVFGEGERVGLPREAVDFVYSYDGSFTVAPFAFDLTVPADVLR